MKLHRLFPAALLVVVVGGCEINANTEDHELRAELNSWVRGQLHPWHVQVYQAICQLEERAEASSPLDDDRQLCGGTGEGGRPSDPPDFDD
jgi:hypothetical protein